MPAKPTRLLTAFATAMIFTAEPALASEPIDEIRLLSAIAQVETGVKNINRPSRRIGARGERTAWQIMPATWACYTSAPFQTAGTDGRLDGLVALAHLRSLRSALSAEGFKPNPYALALAWNAGINAVLRDRLPVGTRDYADRVWALYGALENIPVTQMHGADGAEPKQKT